MVPPTIAPVFLVPLSLPSVSGAAAAPVEVVASSSDVLLAVSVSDSVSVSEAVDEVFVVLVVEVDSVELSVVEVFVVELLVVELFVVEALVVVVDPVEVLFLVPSVVGSDSDIAVAVRGALMVVSWIADWPEAVATTFVAKPEVEPHPY